MTSHEKKTKLNGPKLMGSILICQLAGVVGGIAMASSVRTWYLELNKPFFTPPSWLFGPVWITLYFLMGLSLYWIWNLKVEPQQNTTKRWALYVFFIQLFLNAAWSFSFFGLQMPWLGFVNISLLLVAIVITIVKFNKLHQWASYLLIPYLIWVAFATALNLGLAVLN